MLEGELSIVALANGWVTISGGGRTDRGQADGHPRTSLRSHARLELPQHQGRRHRRRLSGVECARRGVSDAACRPRRRAPLLPARPRRAPDRGGATGGTPRGLIPGPTNPGCSTCAEHGVAPPRATSKPSRTISSSLSSGLHLMGGRALGNGRPRRYPPYSSWRRIQTWNASPSFRPLGVRSRIP